MKKSEMQAHNLEYEAKMDCARAAEREGLYRAALDAAVSAWENIEGMMQYSKKYEEEEFVKIDAIDLILRYSPLLLDSKRLKLLEDLLETRKRIPRNADDDLKSKLATAYAQIKDNHRLWSHIEGNPEARQDDLRQVLGADQTYWRAVAESWEHMGLVVRQPDGGSYRLALTTRMGQIVPAKCPSCGHIDEAPKAMFLEQTDCPKCKSSVLFVLVSRRSPP